MLRFCGHSRSWASAVLQKTKPSKNQSESGLRPRFQFTALPTHVKSQKSVYFRLRIRKGFFFFSVLFQINEFTLCNFSQRPLIWQLFASLSCFADGGAESISWLSDGVPRVQQGNRVAGLASEKLELAQCYISFPRSIILSSIYPYTSFQKQDLAKQKDL